MNRYLRDSSVLDKYFGGPNNQRYAVLDSNRSVEMYLALADKIAITGFVPSVIVGVTRWGNTFANSLSDRFGEAMVYSIGIKSYTGLNVKENPKILQDLGNIKLAFNKVLVVDDIGDSGETLVVAKKEVERVYPESIQQPEFIKTACPVIKNHTNPKPDFWVDETDKWVLFSNKPFENCRHLLGNCLRDLSLEEASKIIQGELNYHQEIIELVIGEIFQKQASF